MNKILIDLEFTGLDNSYIKDNEIIQLKMKNLTNGKTFIQNYGSKKELSAHCQLTHKVKRYDNELFSEMCFIEAMTKLNADFNDEYIGFGVSKDLEMLRKYGISIYQITDIRDMFQRTEYEYRMATEGSGLEEMYFIATGRCPDLPDHTGMEELCVIEELYRIVTVLDQKEWLTVMPFGHCSGMPISDYIEDYRRNADGYRYNNSDFLAVSMDHYIEEICESSLYIDEDE